MKQLRIGLYEHYKGQKYAVIGIARHSETREILVVYIPLYPILENIETGVTMSVKPLTMFRENVKTISGDVPRFKYIGPK